MAEHGEPASTLLRSLELARQAQTLRDTLPVRRVGLGEMADLAELDRLGNPVHGGSDIVEQLPLLLAGHQAEQSAHLAVIIVADAVIIAVGSTRDGQRRLF